MRRLKNFSFVHVGFTKEAKVVPRSLSRGLLLYGIVDLIFDIIYYFIFIPRVKIYFCGEMAAADDIAITANSGKIDYLRSMLDTL